MTAADSNPPRTVVYESVVTAVGGQVEAFLDHGLLIFFGDQAPAELHDISVLHPPGSPRTGPGPGTSSSSGDVTLEVLAVGDVVRDNLLNLGHLDLKADGRTEPKLPGDVCVRVGDLPAAEGRRRASASPTPALSTTTLRQGQLMSYRAQAAAPTRRDGRPLRVGLVGAGTDGPGLRRPAAQDAGHLALRRLRRRAASAPWTRSSRPASRPSTATDTDTAVRRHRERRVASRMGGVEEIGALPLDIVVEATGVPDVGARYGDRGAGLRHRLRHPQRRAGRHRRSLHAGQLAEESGQIYSVCRGDEPVETKILVDFARDLNFEVICAGKGKNNPLDPYATPEGAGRRGRAASR